MGTMKTGSDLVRDGCGVKLKCLICRQREAGGGGGGASG